MKAFIRCCVAAGQLPCVLLVASGAVGWRARWEIEDRLSDYDDGFWVFAEVPLRLTVGPLPADLYPRTWAFVLLALGVVAVVTALVVLLHVPLSSDGE